MDVIMLEGDTADNLMDTVRALADIKRLEQSETAARICYTLAKRMVADADDHATLVADCGKLLEYHNPEPGVLTPELLADRFTRIAQRPHHVEITDEGRVFFVAVTDPNKDGEVWCEFPLSEFTRKGLVEARIKREADAIPTAPAPTTPQ